MSSYQQTKTSGTGMLATMAMLSLTLMGLGSNAITPHWPRWRHNSPIRMFRLYRR